MREWAVRAKLLWGLAYFPTEGIFSEKSYLEMVKVPYLSILYFQK